MGSGQHGDLPGLQRQRLELMIQLRQQGVEDLADRRLDDQGPGQVVDVFAGQGEVDEFDVGLKRRPLAHFRLQPVLDRLDVVIGFAFDPLDLGRVVVAEVLDEFGQKALIVGGQAG